MPEEREAALKAATEWLEEISTEQRLGFDVERRAREDLRDLILAQRHEAKIEALKWVMDESWSGEGHIYEGIEAEIACLEGKKAALDAAGDNKETI